VTNIRGVSTTTPASGAAEVMIKLSHATISAEAVLNHGVTTESSAGVVATRVTNTPALAFRYDLKAGESSSQTVVQEVDGDTGNASTVSLTSTYVGREEVTVPAGTFRQACRFSHRMADTGHSNVFHVTHWVARGSGVMLKSEMTIVFEGQTLSGSQELLSATQNGVAVTP
jgi:hypothetical protein